MNKSTRDFKVFVSDEILDFRILDEISKNKPPAYSKTKSAPSLPDRSDSRSKTRSRTVDPRFRKSRSPPRNLKMASSTTDINNNSNNQREKKTQSTGVLNQNRNFQKPPKPDNTFKTATVKNTIPEIEFFTHKDVSKGSGIRAIPNNAGEYAQDLGDGTFFTEPLRMGEIPPEGAGEIFEDITLDETDLPIRNLELDDCLEDKTSSFWESPKLERSLQIPKARSCINIPTLAKTTSSNLIVCHNCLAAQWLFPEYKYDDMTDGNNSSVSDVKHKIRGTASSFNKALGSIIAIVIVSFLGWILSHLSAEWMKYLPFDLSRARNTKSSIWDHKVLPTWFDIISRKLRDIFTMPFQTQETDYSLFRGFLNNLLR